MSFDAVTPLHLLVLKSYVAILINETDSTVMSVTPLPPPQNRNMRLWIESISTRKIAGNKSFMLYCSHQFLNSTEEILVMQRPFRSNKVITDPPV